MTKNSTYTSKRPDPRGIYTYSAEEDAVWGTLFTRQMAFLKGRATPEYFEGIRLLGLSPDRVPQISDINERLSGLSGAGVEGVPAIIPPAQFFDLLSRRTFPVATFLRRREHMDYIEEPDLFHEVFGHCPLLTNGPYADFVEGFGQKALALGKRYSWHLFRLFWFTVEFGMIRGDDRYLAFGAGIVSSPSEAAHATGGNARIDPFDLVRVLRTPYRIDIVQPVYFAIDSFEQLAACLEDDWQEAIDRATELGDLPPLFDRVA